MLFQQRQDAIEFIRSLGSYQMAPYTLQSLQTEEDWYTLAVKLISLYLIDGNDPYQPFTIAMTSSPDPARLSVSYTSKMGVYTVSDTERKEGISAILEINFLDVTQLEAMINFMRDPMGTGGVNADAKLMNKFCKLKEKIILQLDLNTGVYKEVLEALAKGLNECMESLDGFMYDDHVYLPSKVIDRVHNFSERVKHGLQTIPAGILNNPTSSFWSSYDIIRDKLTGWTIYVNVVYRNYRASKIITLNNDKEIVSVKHDTRYVETINNI